MRLCLARRVIAAIVFVLSAAAFFVRFYPVPLFDIQLTALTQRLFAGFTMTAAVLFVVVAVATILFGRIYCSLICPLGAFQELLSVVFRRPAPVAAGRPYKYVIMAALFGCLIGGTVVPLRFFDPYAVFGAAATGAVFGIAFVALLTVLVWFKGRLFCSDICPVGALLGLMAKHAVFRIRLNAEKCVSCGACAKVCPTGCIDFKNKTVANETCVSCFACTGKCGKGALTYGAKPVPKAGFDADRRRFLTAGAVFGVFAIAVKSGGALSKIVADNLKKVILPPGAGDVGRFANKCLNCNLCVRFCLMKVIQKADEKHPFVHIDYEKSFCDNGCNTCGRVCPSGAIKKLSLAEKQKTRVGLARVDGDLCVQCGMCVFHCPKTALEKDEGTPPRVDKNRCVGCGACQNVCPVGAISVHPVDRQTRLS